MKVALVYDRVNKWGGAERVLLALHEMFPDSPLYTAVYDSSKASWANVFPKVHTSFLQKVPFLKQRHELVGWLMPMSFESFNFSNYDLVISVTSEAAKGIITRPPTKHICYCLTPTRYLWSGYKEYFSNKLLKLISRPAINYLQRWDKVAAQRPDKMIAISTAVQSRIKKYYQRDAEIIFPPVNQVKLKAKKGKHYLIVSRLVAYKKVSLAIRAFNKLQLPLVVVGAGNQERKLKLLAKSNIKFVKNLTDRELAVYYQNTRAFIMPQEEDFGLAAVEAQSLGLPIIAFKAGGALDIIEDGKTGVFFNQQSISGLIKAIKRFAKIKFDREAIIQNAQKFTEARFNKEFKRCIETK